EHALATMGRSTSSAVRVRVLQRIALALFESGDGFAARELFARVVDDATRLGMHSLVSKACSTLSSIARNFVHDQSQRLWYAQKASAAASKGGDTFDLQTAALQRLNIELERGNADGVMAVEKSLGALRTNDTSRLIQVVSHAKAECLTWEGRFEEAYRVSSRSWERIQFVGDRILNAAQCAISAAASGRADESTHLIGRVDGLAEEFSERCDPATIDTAFLWCALAYAISGRHTIAQRELKRPARSDASHIRVLRQVVASSLRVLRNPVVGDGEIGDLLAELTTLGYGGHAKLLQAILDRFAVRRGPETQDETITRSEADVLRALAMGLSPKDIAAETGRSLNTIQVHIQNAIQKLGCHGRQEALTVAQRRGLLG
ncbi:MAG TPA: LuxR C-terminal-related transcriptional regulator, partial [Verrucomicrobiae bacterium]|nr:LuxR C-terminal-related transcriptional regulator [Verrucomicrobiae bacterium]